MKKSHQELLESVNFLYKNYSDELRAVTQPHQLTRMREHDADYVYHPEDKIVRESLLEHVGVLPMLAIELYPYIEDDRVDLGEALKMLAIHDIGELIVGDVSTFKKDTSDYAQEHKAALSLLDPMYHDLYNETEDKKTPTAKFAKSIDKIAPDILDYITDASDTKYRFKVLYEAEPEGIVPLIVKHKRPHMLWNPFMTDFHTYLLDQVKQKLT